MSFQSTENEFPDPTTPLKQLGLRACGTCVKAKVKCVPSTGKGKCQRCLRLNKTCQPSTVSSRKRPPSAQVAQLERKLDSLVTLLSAKDGVQQGVIDATHASRSTSSAEQERITPPLAQEVAYFGPGNHDQPTFRACQSNRPQADLTPDDDPFDFGLERQEASFLLLEFRTQMAPQFPFVVIPSDITSDNLRREKPMLWKAVLTAASYHKPLRQEAMGWKLMQEFGIRLLMKAEKSLDLLQALLVHLAWYHYHSAANPQATNLLYLTKSLLINLGYHRSRTLKDRPKLNLDGPEGLTTDEHHNKSPTLSKTLEEWRALAGCFFVSALTASSCRRMDPLLYTPHLEDVCKRLRDICEYESDRMIMPLIAIQNVVLKMSSSLQELDISSPLNTVPVRMYMSALQDELDAIKRTMPTDIENDHTMISCLQVAEMSLYEIGLYRPFWQGTDKDHRLKTLYSCLLAVKTYFDNHFAPGVNVPASFPYCMWIFNGYSLLLGAKLCFSHADGWDINTARTLLEYTDVIGRITEKLEAILRLRSPHGEYEIFSRYIKQIRCKQLRGAMNLAPRTENRQVFSNASIPPDCEITMSDSVENMFFHSDQQSLLDDQIFNDDFWQGLLDADNDWLMMGQ